MAHTIEGTFKRVGKKRKNGKLAGASGEWETAIPEGDSPRYTNTSSLPLPDNDLSLLDQFRAQYATASANLQSASESLDAAESRAISIQGEVNAFGTPQEQAEFEAAYNRIIAAQSTRDAALNALNTASQWYESVRNALGLGALPLIPWSTVAGIGTFAAVMYAAANGMNSFFNMWQINRWNAENMRLQSEGKPPLTGSPALADTSSIFAGLGDYSMLIVVGIVAFLLMNKGK